MGSVLTQDEAVLKRIWGADYEGVYRVFMSHTYEHKAVAIELKEHLDVYGIRGFVDHVSIRPSQEWSTEIESALSSMDALVALLTEDFHGSEWTDQEIGYALARESKVRLIPVDLGQAPYGFIKKYQALPIQQGSSDSEADWQNAAREIVKVCIEDDRVLDAYVEAVRNCSNFEKANDLYEILPSISSMSKQQEDALISAFNTNFQVNNNFRFSGNQGLVYHLNRLRNREPAFRMITKNKENRIEAIDPPAPREEIPI